MTTPRARRPGAEAPVDGRGDVCHGRLPSGGVANGRNMVDWTRFEAVLFDLDGVLTATATVHARAWKRMFDEYLAAAAAPGAAVRPFILPDDYVRLVDGKPRYDGVRSFLSSRGIRLPDGTPDDPPSAETVGGLGNRKSAYVNDALRDDGVDAYADALALVRHLDRCGTRRAVVSSSRNCGAVLAAARLAEWFEVRVDGVVAETLGLAGKPSPATFLHAARMLGVAPAACVVVEDARVGVEAGRAGRFGLVVGVDRAGPGLDLKAAGADLVVRDLSETVTAGGEAGAGSGPTGG